MGNSNKENNAIKRLSALFDDGIFTEIDPFAKGANGDIEVVAGYGTVNGCRCYAFSQNSDVNNGAITVAQCSKIKKVYDLAKNTGCPVVGIYDSNGVQLTEGFEVLNAYGDVVKSATAVSGVIPQISIIAGACLGTSALMANMADVVIATKDSDYYITAPSEVTAKDSAECGTVDILANDFDEAVSQAINVISMMPENNLYSAPIVDLDFSAPNVLANSSSSAEDIISSIVDGSVSVELKADYAQKVITKLATFEGQTVGVICFKGMPLCGGCSYKAESFIKLCDAFNIPIITVVNNDGLKKDDEQKVLTAVTKLTSAYATATCPKISLIVGQAIGTAYIVLAGKGANADVTLAWEDTVVSPLDVDAAVAFLYNDRLANGEDRNALAKEYKETIGSAYTAAACGAIDDVFAPDQTRAKISEYLDMLASKRETTIPRKHSVK